MTSPLVSVVIPCYNTGRFLHIPIESILAQPYKNYELLIVDDGSTDTETLQILDKIQHPQARVIRQKNRGLAGARNGGIEQARGKYVLPIDADDKIAPICLTKSVEILEAMPNVAVVYGNVQYFGDENRLARTPPFNGYRLLFANPIPVCSMFRRTAWENVGGYTESVLGFEDWDFWLKLMEKGYKFHRVEEILFMYHKRYNSDYYGTLKIYKKAMQYIRDLHPKMFSKENMNRVKKEWNVSWWEDLIWHIPVTFWNRFNKITPLRWVKDQLSRTLWKPSY